LTSPRRDRAFRAAARTVAAAVFVGFSAVPVAVAANLIR